LIVIDASAAVDLVLGIEPRAGEVLRAIEGQGSGMAAPHLLDAEVGQVLRRLVLQRVLTKGRVLQAIEDLAALPIQRFAHGFLLGRAFALHHNITVYDALYVALAEALRVPLLTCDRALASVPGLRAKVVVIQ
jgi:predicted nucleic acid-binding protein